MNTTTVGFFGFILCVIASRILSERAFRTLPNDQKVTLMDAFSGMRAYSLVPLLVIVGVMFGLPRLYPEDPRMGLFLGLGLLVAYVLGIHVLVVRRLRSLEIDAGYQKRFLLARHISHAGMFILFGCLLFDTFR